MPGVSTNMRIDDVNKEYIYLMLAISLRVSHLHDDAEMYDVSSFSASYAVCAVHPEMQVYA
jgi:hypothetical protein